MLFLTIMYKFFNTEPHFGGIVNGMVIAMEEKRANGAEITDDAINSIKTGLMGPMAGIGDTLWQGTLHPILLAVEISIAATGNVLGAVIFTVMMAAIMLPLAYMMYMRDYKAGKTGVEAINFGGFDYGSDGARLFDRELCIGNAGKIVLYSSIHPANSVLFNPNWVHGKSIQILGTANSNDRDFIRAAKMVSEGIIDMKPFISEVYPANEIKEAFESAAKADKFRVVVKFC